MTRCGSPIPRYGIDSHYEGDQAESEIGGCHVYRVDPQSGACHIVADDFVRPNGLAFSPDEQWLYVADSGGTSAKDGPRHIRKFRVDRGQELSGGQVFAECTAGFFDGLRCDESGRIWTSAGDGVHVYHQDSTLLGKIKIPERVANLVFGGAKRNHLFICATTSVYSMLLPVRGARTF